MNYLLVGVPFACEESMLVPDDLAVKKSCQSWILVGQSLNLQVAAHVRIFYVHILQVDVERTIGSFIHSN